MPKQKMSPDELSACRKRLEQVWKNRIVDEGLLHQAWHTAHEVKGLNTFTDALKKREEDA